MVPSPPWSKGPTTAAWVSVDTVAEPASRSTINTAPSPVRPAPGAPTSKRAWGDGSHASAAPRPAPGSPPRKRSAASTATRPPGGQSPGPPSQLSSCPLPQISGALGLVWGSVSSQSSPRATCPAGEGAAASMDTAPLPCPSPSSSTNHVSMGAPESCTTPPESSPPSAVAACLPCPTGAAQAKISTISIRSPGPSWPARLRVLWCSRAPPHRPRHRHGRSGRVPQCPPSRHCRR